MIPQSLGTLNEVTGSQRPPVLSLLSIWIQITGHQIRPEYNSVGFEIWSELE
jgi:hypothetical protein